MTKIKVLIADNHAMVREGLKLALDNHKNIKVIGEATNGKEAVKLALELKPHIVLMDISMPEMNGIEAAVEIKSHDNNIKIIMLTMLDSEKFIVDAMSVGIDGYLFKESGIKELATAINRVYEGGEYLNKEVTDKILSYIRGRSFSSQTLNGNNTPPLTPREIEVLTLVSKGHTSKTAAEKLFISELTVVKHRKNIIKKLGVKNLAEAVSYAASHGLI
ncbi:MAG: response regulator transcription factor [Bacteroidota bacterium]